MMRKEKKWPTYLQKVTKLSYNDFFETNRAIAAIFVQLVNREDEVFI